MKNFIYEGNKTREISFPLGGIGTGSLGISGNGRLIDWEIFNKPSKRSFNSFSHFAIKAEENGKLIDAKVLNSDLMPSYMGQPVRDSAIHNGYGFGPDRNTMAGLPHFEHLEFVGEFPLATLNFHDNKFPGKVKMLAFNPFIPLNDLDSSLPGAFFEIEVENNSTREIDYTICFSVANPLATQRVENKLIINKSTKLIKLSSHQFDEDDVKFGDVSISTDEKECSYQEYWYRGSWSDNLEMYWKDFTRPGRLINRNYENNEKFGERYSTTPKDIATLATHIKLSGGEKKCVRFVITWSYPNATNFWSGEINKDEKDKKPVTWKNYYSTIFKDSEVSALYCMKNYERLYKDTLEFKELLFSSTVPCEVIDAISANISILKTPTCLRLTDGSFYGFEGCIEDMGCCEGSCTHVWNYAYALPFLFPKLERSMRNLDFLYNQREDGKMSFRLPLPIGTKGGDFHACVDGQFGGVIKSFRDWKISGDDEWLRSNWEAIKKSIEFAWAKTNEDKWDVDKDGVVEGRQHHTLDMELFGPNSWLNGFYLGALKAGSIMAEYLGYHDIAKEYMELFDNGKKWTDENLFNGEYYIQKIDLSDKTIVGKFNEGLSIFGDNGIKAYWNDEVGEIKYQIGEGCSIDQVLAQWHANICGLGEIFDKNQTKMALEAIYKNNFIKRMGDYANTWRLYSLNDEGGLIICSYPEGKKVPVIPVPYNSETMNGFEYQAAAHMIQEGYIEEGLTIVKAIRERYDGEKRNPWNEFECGSNYARSMASYSLLLALSGFEFDMVKKHIGFSPKINSTDFKTFWSLASGWGQFTISKDELKLGVSYGKLELNSFSSIFLESKSIKEIYINDIVVNFIKNKNLVEFDKIITIDKNHYLKLIMKV